MNPINRFVSALRGRSASRGPASSDMRYEVANPARGTVLATRTKVAETAPQRSKGLLGREGLAPGEGLWIVPCESVHTFFMRFPIDLVYLDRKNKIKKVRSDIGAWRMSACLSDLKAFGSSPVNPCTPSSCASPSISFIWTARTRSKR